jgi:hypothetical protein
MLPRRIAERSRFLGFAHVLIGKPVPAFPGHALALAAGSAQSFSATVVFSGTPALRKPSTASSM